MIFKNVSSRAILILVLVTSLFGLAPTRAGAERSTEPVSQGQDCDPDAGAMWTPGPSMPEVALQVQQELSLKGIEAVVEAKGYGETDSCGTYTPHGIDFTVQLAETASNSAMGEQALADAVLPVLVEFGKPNLGNIRLFSGRGETIPLTRGDILPAARAPAGATLGEPTIRKVYVIAYDPLLSNGQKLSERMHWNSHATITQQTIDLFSQATNNKLNYTVVGTTVVTSGWPELVDGFKYTEQQFLAVMSNPGLHHEPTGVNYNKIVNSPDFDICGKVNRGEIDEVWIYNGPWFGFFESTLVGPGSYPLNSTPVPGPFTCSRIIPIMGPSVERTVQEAVHNFGHRTEATMSKVYGGWQENRTAHNWDRFGLVKFQSPNYSYGGCGSAHYAANGVRDYDYGNPGSVLSNCADFANYPNLGDPLQVSQPVTCAVWGCNELSYFRYWFGHIPTFPGCGPDYVANDWWNYILDPGAALDPSATCLADAHSISGNTGTGGVTLSFTDGMDKTATSDGSGNYLLFVSNHWSGTVVPSKFGYSFSPAFREYADVQSNLSAQDYTAERLDIGGYYVNVATGDNGNSCLSAASPCRNIQEAINKAGSEALIRVASGTYLFSTNATPNVLIINKSITLTGGWNAGFTARDGVSIIDGADTNNGILVTAGTVVVENFVVQNSRGYNSGGIYIGNGNFTLKRSTLRNNTATSRGAGIFLDNGVLNVINSTISGNTASDRGGGIYAGNTSNASISIQSSTITYNTAYRGGGVSQGSGTYNVTNSIIANNVGTNSNPDCEGTLATANFNIIENMTGCSITSGSNNLHVDPTIDLNLTGSLPLHVTLTGSAALDVGDDAHCPATDQRGLSRPQGPHCDIGAYEHDYEGPTVPTTTMLTTAPNPSVPGQTALATATVSSAGGTPTGTVDFSVAGTVLCTKTLTNASATCNLILTETGTVVAAYQPNNGYYQSSSDSVVHQIVLDATPPSVSSIVRAGADPTSAASAAFTVTFSEPVTGVSTIAPFNDFSLTTTGVTGASITGVDGADSVWTVTVNTGSGSGTIHLNVPATATITDTAGNPLANLPVTGGETYTIEKAPGPGAYEDTDLYWAYSGSWTTYNGTGPTNNTSGNSNAIGSQAQFSFNGVKFIFTYLKASNRGLIDVYVDGAKIAQINARSSSLAWQQTWTSPTFTPGIHTVRFVHAGGGTYIDVDAIEIFGAPPTVPAGDYDDNHAAWVFGSGWTAYTGTGPYNGTSRYTNTPGNDAQITFNGTKFVFTYVKGSNRGLIDVFVDGSKVGQINARGSTTTWQSTWTSPVLTPGVHTVRFVHAGGGTYIDVDKIQILGPTDTIAPAAISDLAAATGTATGTVDLHWTAPGDDNTSGTATGYLVRYSTSEITGDNTWNAATPVASGIPTPAAAAGAESMTVSGLTPGETYFFAVRAQDEEANLGGVSNSPSIAAQSVTAVTAGTYDDTDINWIYTGAWTAYTGTGPANNTSHYATTSGSEAQITIEGAKFTFTYVKASNRGLIDVYVDGVKIAQINARSTSTAWQAAWISPDLTPGEHIVRFVYAGGTYIDVDKIQVFDAPAVPTSGSYDDRDSGWTFGSGWTDYDGPGPLNNTSRYTSVVGSEAQFTFTGTGFTFTYVRASNRGSIDVYVDGTKVGTLNARSTSTVWQQTWTGPVLTPGQHTVRFVHAGNGTYIDVDAITITP